MTNQKICIVVADGIDSGAFRSAPPHYYDTKAKKSEKDRKAEIESQLASGGWPRAEEEGINLADFNRIVKKFYNGDRYKADEFRAGYLSVPSTIGKPFFTNPETQQLFARYNPRVINRNEYLQIIEAMRKMIVDQYHQTLHDRHNWQGVLESKLEMWESPHEFPYDLDCANTRITNVYTAEIQIWDLIRMYKAIDWLRDNVIVYYL